MKLKNLPKKRRKEAKKLFKSITPVPGETRQASYCTECDQIMGARYISGGLGQGYRVNTCHCRITGNARMGTLHTLIRESP